MKTVTFGRDESKNPTGTFNKKGTDDGIIVGDYLELVGIGSSVYLVTEVIDALDEDKLRKIYVKEALADIYADGSATLYVNAGNKETCKKLEEKLNSAEGRMLLFKGELIKETLGKNKVPRSFDLCIKYTDNIQATEIDEDVFNEKKEMIEISQEPISEIQRKLTEAYVVDNEHYL